MKLKLKRKKIKTFLISLGSSVLLIFIFSFIQDNNSYLKCPKLIKNPSSTVNYSAENRHFTGIPSLAISSKGRMWAVWYAGITPGEDQNNYVVVATSVDGGQNWKEILAIDPDGPGPARSYDPEVWIDPKDHLWIFWAQAAPKSSTWSLITEGTSAGVWAVTTKNPDYEIPKWSKPRRLTDGVMMCKPTILSNGEWVLPVSNWRLAVESARIVVSADNGKSWFLRGAVDVPKDVRQYDEHMIVERKDGSLWMLVRTKYGIGESISSDYGRSWSLLTSSKIQHPSARFFIRRLNSGNLLLVKHGPIDVQTRRSDLMAFVSEDDGHSWSKGLLLDKRLGVSYPDGQETKDGHINVIYDYNRTKDQLILLTSFTEDEILAITDSLKNDISNRSRVVSKGGKN